MKFDYVTNCPEAAKAIKKAVGAFLAARRKAKNLPLAEKIVAYRKAKEDFSARIDALNQAKGE